MTIAEAKDSLVVLYASQGLFGPFPKPLLGCSVMTYQGEQVIRIDVNLKSIGYIPNESKPGIGYQGFRCVAWRGAGTVVSDSGDIV